MESILRSFWPAAILSVTTTILLCLPGNKLPVEDWLDLIWADKWVHVFLFAGLVALWAFPLINHPRFASSHRQKVIRIALAILLYGIGMEVIQHFWIPDRSFDALDILADAAGCGMGFIVIGRYTKLEKL